MLGVNSRLIHWMSRGILQDSRRLRTIQVPQENPIPLIAADIFDPAAFKTLLNYRDAFVKLQQVNQEIHKVDLSSLTLLQVDTMLGQFSFESESGASTLYYRSPFNGVFKYYYDLSESRFRSNKDNHLLEENVAREVMYKFKGLLEV